MSDNKQQAENWRYDRLIAIVETRIDATDKRLEAIEKRICAEMSRLTDQVEQMKYTAAKRKGIDIAAQWMVGALIGASGWAYVIFDLLHGGKPHP